MMWTRRRRNMDRYGIAAIMAVLLLASACSTTESKPASEKPAAQTSAAPGTGGRPNLVTGDVLLTTAMVEAIDKKNRILTLRNADGSARTLAVDPAVKNFDQIERGDKVRAEYLESVAVYIEAPGSASGGAAPAGAAGSARAVEVAPKGEKPSGVVVDTVERRATVKDIDYVNRLVTLSNPDGYVQTVRVDPKAGDLTPIRVGDQILIRQTRSLAIAVTKA